MTSFTLQIKLKNKSYRCIGHVEILASKTLVQPVQNNVLYIHKSVPCAQWVNDDVDLFLRRDLGELLEMAHARTTHRRHRPKLGRWHLTGEVNCGKVCRRTLQHNKTSIIFVMFKFLSRVSTIQAYCGSNYFKNVRKKACPLSFSDHFSWQISTKTKFNKFHSTFNSRLTVMVNSIINKAVIDSSTKSHFTRWKT